MKNSGFVDIKPMLAVFSYAAGGITGHKKNLLLPAGVLIPWITTDIYVAIIVSQFTDCKT